MCLLKSYSPYDNVRKTDFTISKFCAKHPDFHPPPSRIAARLPLKTTGNEPGDTNPEPSYIVILQVIIAILQKLYMTATMSRAIMAANRASHSILDQVSIIKYPRQGCFLLFFCKKRKNLATSRQYWRIRTSAFARIHDSHLTVLYSTIVVWQLESSDFPNYQNILSY